VYHETVLYFDRKESLCKVLRSVSRSTLYLALCVCVCVCVCRLGGGEQNSWCSSVKYPNNRFDGFELLFIIIIIIIIIIMFARMENKEFWY
jgi:hypothetical protein